MLLWSQESLLLFIRTKILSCEFRIPCALVVIFYIGIAARTRRIHVQLLTFGILMPLCQWLERYLLQCGVENNYVFWHRRLFSVQYHTAKRVLCEEVLLWGLHGILKESRSNDTFPSHKFRDKKQYSILSYKSYGTRNLPQ